MQVKKQQLELDMEQQTGSKSEKEYIKVVYCHPAYLSHKPSTSCEMLVLKKHKPVNPKGNQPWIFIGRTDAEAEAPVIYPLDVKSWLIGKDPDARKDWGQEENGVTEDEVARWHHWLDGNESE